jgi:RNA polymerase sigma-70 factor, ECF subfamily
MSLSTQHIPSSKSNSTACDSELVLQAQGGDDLAFALLYERYYYQLYSYITCMIGDREVGKDLAQEAFIKAWKGLSNLRDTSRFAGWLYRITTNLANDYLRSTKRIRWLSWDRNDEREINKEVRGVGLEVQIAEQELLIQALSHVSATYRPCLILYYVEKFKQCEIAKMLQMKEGTVSKYVGRGLAELRREYTNLSGEFEHSSETGRYAG